MAAGGGWVGGGGRLIASLWKVHSNHEYQIANE